MFMYANEARNIAYRARTITMFGILCQEIAQCIEEAAKRGCEETTICSGRLGRITIEEQNNLTDYLTIRGYTVKWQSVNDQPRARLHINWGSVE